MTHMKSPVFSGHLPKPQFLPCKITIIYLVGLLYSLNKEIFVLGDKVRYIVHS